MLRLLASGFQFHLVKMSGGGGGGGSAAANMTSQRLRMEQSATSIVQKLFGLQDGGNKSKQQQQQFGGLERALQSFYDRLPYNQGAALCIEDLQSFIRKQITMVNVTDAIQATITYLNAPPFAEHLAAFGRLPGQSYILVFDPYAYQSITPPSLAVSKALDPSAFAPSTNNMMPSKAELEQQDKELEQIFNEDLKSSKVPCPKCKDGRFVRYREVQARSADEGSSYQFYCAACPHAWWAR
jgi:DNA-directed RNA polymerase subunit M/transcription elongation factor TFIIS